MNQWMNLKIILDNGLLIDLEWMSVCVRVSVCVCLPPRLLITNGVIWTIYNWLNKFYSCYVATAVSVDDGHILGSNTDHEN